MKIRTAAPSPPKPLDTSPPKRTIDFSNTTIVLSNSPKTDTVPINKRSSGADIDHTAEKRQKNDDFPVELYDFNIVNFGELGNPKSVKYNQQKEVKYYWPIGFKSEGKGTSLKNKFEETSYAFEIKLNNEGNLH